MKRSQRCGKSGRPRAHGSRFDRWLAARTKPCDSGRCSCPTARSRKSPERTGQLAKPMRRYGSEGRTGGSIAPGAENPPREVPREGFAMVTFMGKTLVIAEKPSVGRELAEALPGAF